MAPRPQQTKVERWDNDANIIFNERIESGDIFYTEDSQELDNFNREYFSRYCDFMTCDKIYQARKRLWDKLRRYQQGIDLDEDRPAFRNNTPNNEDKDEDYNNPKDPPSPPSPLPRRQRADPVAAPSPVNIDLARDLEALTMSMKLYSKEVKMPWLRATTVWKTDGTRELVFDFLAYPFSIDKYFFDVDDDGLGMEYSLMLPYDFYKVDGENPRHMHPGTESSMLEACAQVHRENDSSFNSVMSDKIRVGPFPWKVETAIKSVTLLTDMESDKDLFEVLRNDDDVPPGAEFQIPCVVCVVLVGQESHMGLKWSVSIPLTHVVLLLLVGPKPT